MSTQCCVVVLLTRCLTQKKVTFLRFLKEFGLDGAVLDFLDSKVDDEASAAERLTARLTNTFEGALLGLPIEAIVQGFKAVRSDEGAVEIIRNKLATVKEKD